MRRGIKYFELSHKVFNIPRKLPDVELQIFLLILFKYEL